MHLLLTRVLSCVLPQLIQDFLRLILSRKHQHEPLYGCLELHNTPPTDFGPLSRSSSPVPQPDSDCPHHAMPIGVQLHHPSQPEGVSSVLGDVPNQDDISYLKIGLPLHHGPPRNEKGKHVHEETVPPQPHLLLHAPHHFGQSVWILVHPFLFPEVLLSQTC